MEWGIIVGFMAIVYYFSFTISKLDKRLDQIEAKKIGEANFYEYLDNFMAFLRFKKVWSDADFDDWNMRIENRKLAYTLKEKGLFDEKRDKNLIDD